MDKHINYKCITIAATLQLKLHIKMQLCVGISQNNFFIFFKIIYRWNYKNFPYSTFF